MKNDPRIKKKEPMEIYHGYKLYYLQKLIWEGNNLEEAPATEVPLGIRMMKGNTKTAEDFWKLYASENGSTWRVIPLSKIHSAKQKKK